MKNKFIIFVVFSIFASIANAKDEGFLTYLKKDQLIILEEKKEGFYVIKLIKNQGTHKIIQINSDSIVVEDLVGIQERRINIFFIREIITIKVIK